MPELSVSDQILAPKHRWFSIYQDIKFNARSRGGARHMLFLGGSGTGKTTFVNWLAEYEILSGEGKLIQLGVKEQNTLEEIFSFYRGRKPKNVSELDAYRKCHRLPTEWQEKVISGEIKVKVFVPLSKNLPYKLPENFIPFTIPIKSLEKPEIGDACFSALSGAKEYRSMLETFMTAVRQLDDDGTPFEFMSTLESLDWKKTRKGFMNVDIPFSSDVKSGRERFVFEKFEAFFEEGILDSVKSPYALFNQLLEEIKDQKSVCVLYLGFVSSPMIQLFVQIYFVKMIQHILDTTGVRKQIKHDILLFWDDAGEVFTASKQKIFREADIAPYKLFLNVLTRGRHFGIVAFVSIHSVMMLEPTMVFNFPMQVVTSVEADEEIEWVKGKSDESAFHIAQVFERFDYLRRQSNPVFRFVFKTGNIPNIPTWKTGNVEDYGYELPRPRLSEYGKIETWSRWGDCAELLGLELTDKPLKAMQYLRDQWKEASKRIREKQKGKGDSHKDLEEAEEMKNSLLVRDFMVQGLEKQEISRRIGHQAYYLERIAKKLKEYGLIDQALFDKYRPKSIKTLKLETKVPVPTPQMPSQTQ